MGGALVTSAGHQCTLTGAKRLVFAQFSVFSVVLGFYVCIHVIGPNPGTQKCSRNIAKLISMQLFSYGFKLLQKIPVQCQVKLKTPAVCACAQSLSRV